MRKADENRAENYIRKHSRYKKWIVIALCLSLLSGTLTFYMLNKPATAMTEEGAKQVGLVLETADSDFENGLIEQMENGEDENSEGGQESGNGDENKDSGETPEGSSEGNSEGTADEASEDKSQGSEEASDAASSESTSGDNAAEGDSSEAVSESSSSLAASDASSDSSEAASSASSDDTSSEASSEASSKEAEVTNKDVKGNVKITVVYKDVNGEEVAESKELSISESFDLTREVKNIEGYLFDKGTIDETQVVLITKKTTSAKEENTDAASTASSSDEVKSYTYYQATTASGETKDILEDTELLLTYNKLNTQTSFTATDGKVTAQAVLSDPSSLPEGVELSIAEITSKSEDYAYDAYMQALNNNADKIADSESVSEAEEKKAFDDTNTLIYDIAFKLGGVEYQPKEGTVSISLSLNRNQLSTNLGATSSDGVSVVHLPVKEEIMENVDATSDATDIKASDIDVEVIKESDVDLSGNTDKVTFETDSFSAYALVYNAYGSIISWDGINTMSAKDVVKSLGDCTSFGAVAGTFESDPSGTTDVETNIAVGTLKRINEFGNTSNVYTHVDFTGYYITKNSTVDGTFGFGLYAEEYTESNRNPKNIGYFTIKVENKTGTVNLTDLFDEGELRKYARLYVYELDGDTNIVPDGESYSVGGHKFTVTYGTNDLATESDNDLVGSFSSSYIENDQSGINLYSKLKQVKGDTVYVKLSDSSYISYTWPDDKAGTMHEGTFPISVSSMLNTSAEAAKKMALLRSTDEVMVINAIGTSDGFQKDVAKVLTKDMKNVDLNNYLTSQGINIGNKLLIINLDLTLVGGNYELKQFKVNTDKESELTGQGWSEIANQIIINPLQRVGVENELVPYTGTLRLNTVSGTINAPKARVEVADGCHPGAVIADYIFQTREIHKLVTNKYKESQGTMVINNVSEADDIITIKADKYIDGKLATAEDTGKFSFTLVMMEKYDNGQYYWKWITNNITNKGSTISYDINPTLYGMTYGTSNSNKDDHTYYFVLYENDVALGRYNKDASVILIKIKYYKGGEKEPLYYRINSEESEKLQSNPGTGFFNDDHRISSKGATAQYQNVAFYNESKGTSDLRIHKMVVNDFGSGFVRDNTGTALLSNVTFKITNNSTGNYVVVIGFTGDTDKPKYAKEYDGKTHKETGKTYEYYYNRSAQWTVRDLPIGTYTVEEVGDGLTFTYDPSTDTSTIQTDTNLSRVTMYGVTTDKEGASKIGPGGVNYRAVFAVDVPGLQHEIPKAVRVGLDEIDNPSHTETVQICNFYSIPIGPIQVTKNFSGGTWDKDMEFTFVLSPVSYTATNSEGVAIPAEALPSQPMPVGSSNGVATVTLTGENATRNENGTYSAIAQFAAIPFRFEGRYIYKITEQNTGAYGISYDHREYYVEIVVNKRETWFNKKYTYDNMANPAKYTKDTELQELFWYLGATVTYATDINFSDVLAVCDLSLGTNPDTVVFENNKFIVTYKEGDVKAVAFNNTRTGELTVKKTWKGTTGEDISGDRSSLTLLIWQRTADTDWKGYGTVTLSPDNNWTQTVTGLPIYNEKGNLYKYTVKESDDYLATYLVAYKYNGNPAVTANDQDYITVSNEKMRDTGYAMTIDSSGMNYGEVVITNEVVYTNTLPSTGGVGTAPFTVIGLITAFTALAAGLFFSRRKKTVL